MKKAKLIPFAIDVVCPYCGEEAENENEGGSLMWTVDELEPGEVFGCNNCGELYQIPSRVQGVALVKSEAPQ
jgi:hypothetical protein